MIAFVRLESFSLIDMGEIFNEYNIPISKERDEELFQNYKEIMKTHWSNKFWIK